MDKLRVGQRINDDSLGYGVIVKIIQGAGKKVFAYMVMYEKEPPKEYNGGVNPCLRWGSDLSVVGRSEQLLAVAEYVYNHFDDSSSKTAKDYLQDFLSQRK